MVKGPIYNADCVGVGNAINTTIFLLQQRGTHLD